MAGQLAKNFLRTAGTALGSYLDDALRLGGNVGQNVATSALKRVKSSFTPELIGKTGKEVPMLLREGPKSAIPTAGRLLGQGAVFGTGLAAAGMLDQQSQHTQPIRSGTGDRSVDQFLYSQQLQNQKFMHDMMLVQARAESRTPGAQYGTSQYGADQYGVYTKNRGELGPRAFEKGLLDEVGVFGRGLYGTGLRA